MSTLHRIYHMLGRFKYWVVIIGIILVNGFLDENSFYMRHKRLAEIDQLRSEIAMLKERYQADDERLQELNNNPRAVERLAREKYHMKRPNEDVFVVMEGSEEVEEAEVEENEVPVETEKPAAAPETSQVADSTQQPAASDQPAAVKDSTSETAKPAQP